MLKKLKATVRKGFAGVRTKVYGFAGFAVATWAAWSINPTAGKFTLAGSLLLIDFGSKK